MQRDRTSKYSWSVRGLLPGRQRFGSSFANVHSQGARWVMLYQLYGLSGIDERWQPFAVSRLLAEAGEAAVASRVQRGVRPHGCSEALGRVACLKFMAMEKVDAERTSSFAS